MLSISSSADRNAFGINVYTRTQLMSQWALGLLIEGVASVNMFYAKMTLRTFKCIVSWSKALRCIFFPIVFVDSIMARKNKIGRIVRLFRSAFVGTCHS